MKISKKAEKALNGVLETGATELAGVIKAGAAAVKGAGPGLVRDIIVFNGYISNGAVALVSLAVGVACVVAGIEANAGVLGHVLAGAGVLLSLTFFMAAAYDGLKARYAPKLFLIEYAMNLTEKDDE